MPAEDRASKVRDGRFSIGWAGLGRTAQCKPDPAYPDGVDMDLRGGNADGCRVALPYPASSCGLHLVECLICGLRVAVTAAGRPDDPRIAILPCRPLARA